MSIQILNTQTSSFTVLHLVDSNCDHTDVGLHILLTYCLKVYASVPREEGRHFVSVLTR